MSPLNILKSILLYQCIFLYIQDADSSCLQFVNWQPNELEELICSTTLKDIPPWKQIREGFSSHQVKPFVMELNCKKGFLSNVHHSFTIILFRQGNDLHLGINFNIYDYIDPHIIYHIKMANVNSVSPTGGSSKMDLTEKPLSNALKAILNAIPEYDQNGRFFWTSYGYGSGMYRDDVKRDTYIDIFMTMRRRVETVSCYGNGNNNTSMTIANTSSSSSYIDTTKYFLSSELSDIILRPKHGYDPSSATNRYFQLHNHEQGIPAHRFILVVKSGYFAALLRSKESNAEATTIDCSPTCVMEFLRFIYTGEAALSNDLCLAADTYKVEGLKESCKQYLSISDGKVITSENVLQVYEKAAVEQNEWLQREAKQVIMAKKEVYLKDQSALRELAKRYPDVALELLRLE